MTALVLLGLVAALVAPAPAHGGRGPASGGGAGLEERLGARVPADLTFRDAAGRSVRLGDALGRGKPVVLLLADYTCSHLCRFVIASTAEALAAIGWTPGEQYRAVAVSIDPDDHFSDGARHQAAALARLGRPDAADAWPFLVGPADASRALAERIGFEYRYEARGDQFDHPAAIVVLTPEGRVSRYLYGVKFPPHELKLALLEASEGRTGSALERIVMRCYRYDPATRRYAFVVEGVLKAGGALVLLGLGGLLVTLRRRAPRPRSSG